MLTIVDTNIAMVLMHDRNELCSCLLYGHMVFNCPLHHSLWLHMEVFLTKTYQTSFIICTKNSCWQHMTINAISVPSHYIFTIVIKWLQAVPYQWTRICNASTRPEDVMTVALLIQSCTYSLAYFLLSHPALGQHYRIVTLVIQGKTLTLEPNIFYTITIMSFVKHLCSATR